MLTTFTFSVAGFSVGVTCRFASTMEHCRAYLTDAPVDFTLIVAQSDVEAERVHPGNEVFSEAYLEWIALLRLLAEQLSMRSVLLFHGCCVCMDGRAYLFAAPSGTGKSTHASLWLKNIPGSWILNGDKPFLAIREGCPIVFGTPWMGKEGWGRNASAPLKAICILSRGETNEIHPITFHEALPRLLSQGYRPASQELLPAIQLYAEMTPQVKFYHLSCNMQDEAAAIAYNAMRDK